MLIAAGIHLLVLLVLAALARLWPEADRPVVVFCGGQKSIATGIPLVVAAVVGLPAAQVALLLLPLIAYHLVQLLIDAPYAWWWGQRLAGEDDSSLHSAEQH